MKHGFEDCLIAYEGQVAIEPCEEEISELGIEGGRAIQDDGNSLLSLASKRLIGTGVGDGRAPAGRGEDRAADVARDRRR